MAYLRGLIVDPTQRQMRHMPALPIPSAAGPKELWLQLHGDCSESEVSEPVDYTGDDVTWCWHQINSSDVRYVRADLAGAAPEPTEQQIVRLALKHSLGSEAFDRASLLAFAHELRAMGATRSDGEKNG